MIASASKSLAGRLERGHSKLAWRVAGAICCVASLAIAQDAPKKPAVNPARQIALPLDGQAFDDPSKWLEQFLGTREEDRKALDAMTVSVDDERRLGKSAVEAYLRQLRNQKIRVVTKGKDVEYLQSLVAELLPFMRNRERYRTIDVLVAESKETDARSFPGGTLIFFRGILQFVENEAALVGIVGHELSHLDHGHQLIDVKKMKLAEQMAQKGNQSFSPEQFLSSGSTMMRLWSRPFRPEDESQADRDGVTWAYQAGYDPREMARLFLRFNPRQPDGRGFVPAFFRTHPLNRDRHEAVMARFDELQTDEPQEDLYIGTENLRRRIPRSMQAFGE